MPVAVIFDVDGVLADTHHAMWLGCNKVFEVHGGNAPATPRDFLSTVCTPFGKFYRERGAVGSDDEFTKTYFSVADHDGSPLFADVRMILPQLYRRGIIMGIISGHKQTSLRERFRQVQLDGYFRSIVGDTHDKVGAMQSFSSSHGVPPERVYYVGDLISDVRDAREAGIVPVGITRDSGTGPALLAAGATHCIDHLADLLSIVSQANAKSGSLVS